MLHASSVTSGFLFDGDEAMKTIWPRLWEDCGQCAEKLTPTVSKRQDASGVTCVCSNLYPHSQHTHYGLNPSIFYQRFHCIKEHFAGSRPKTLHVQENNAGTRLDYFTITFLLSTDTAVTSGDIFFGSCAFILKSDIEGGSRSLDRHLTVPSTVWTVPQ